MIEALLYRKLSFKQGNMKAISFLAGFPTGITLIAAFLICVHSLHAGEVKETKETYDNGKPKIRYHTDDKDRRVGNYDEWYANGHMKIHGQYAAGKKTGLWRCFDENGKLHEVQKFRGDLLDGPYLWNFPSGKPGLRGNYRLGQLNGPLTVFDEKGRITRQISYPRPLEEVKKAFLSLYFSTKPPVEFTTEPVTTPPYKAGDLSPKCLDAALKVTRLYRYLSGAAWQDVNIDPTMCGKSAHAAVLLTKLGTLTHTPKQPDDMDSSFFDLAYAGCNKANLFMGSGNPVDAVRGFMDDSDASNVDLIGHRQWVLNPGMMNVGFGSAGRFVSMYVVGNDRARADFDFVAFPGEGFYPLELIGAHFAWSVHVNSRKAKVGPIGSLKVTLQKLDEHYQPDGGPVAAKVVSTPSPVSPSLGWSTIVFKPDFTDWKASRYWVDISGISFPSGQEMPFGYVVDLIEIKQDKP